MARPPRLKIVDGIYHVTARGNEARSIYKDVRDRRCFLEILTDVRMRFRWRLLAYCLMRNHYHLLIQTPEANLTEGMHRLNSIYAQRFNRRHKRVGHLFQGRYGARLVQGDEHLLSTTRYIVMNPVRAGLCADPQEWRWSSHNATRGAAPGSLLDVTTLLSYYAMDHDVALRRYREHTSNPVEPCSCPHPLVDGDDEFIMGALRRLQPVPGIPARYFRGPRPVLSSLLSDSRDMTAISNARQHGYSLREIGRHLGISASTLSRRLRRNGAEPRSQRSRPGPTVAK